MEYPKRVVVTGMGSVNSLGLTVPETWKNVCEGKSGIGLIKRIDTSSLQVKIAGEIKGFDPQIYISAKDARRMDLVEQYAIAASQEAIDQAQLDIEKEDTTRIGVIISSAVGGLKSMQDGILKMDKQGTRRISPFLIPMFMPNGAAGLVAIQLGAQGPCLSVASACASAEDGIGQAAMMMGGKLDYFVNTIFNYPTLAEAYKVAALDAWNRLHP